MTGGDGADAFLAARSTAVIVVADPAEDRLAGLVDVARFLGWTVVSTPWLTAVAALVRTSRPSLVVISSDAETIDARQVGEVQTDAPQARIVVAVDRPRASLVEALQADARIRVLPALLTTADLLRVLAEPPPSPCAGTEDARASGLGAPSATVAVPE